MSEHRDEKIREAKIEESFAADTQIIRASLTADPKPQEYFDARDRVRAILLSALQQYREEDKHESSLIDHRMGWLLTTESFLITCFAIIANNTTPLFSFLVTFCLAAIGWVAADLLGEAVNRADQVILWWHRDRERRLLDVVENLGDKSLEAEIKARFVRSWKYEPPPYDPVTHAPKGLPIEDETHLAASAFQRRIRLLFRIAWVFLFTCSLFFEIVMPFARGGLKLLLGGSAGP